MAKVINLTPHDINLFDPSGSKRILTIPSQGVVRAKMETEPLGILYTDDGIALPIVNATYGPPEGPLPEFSDEVAIIVSHIAAQSILSHHPEWTGHILVPDTGPGSVVRDENGRILGVRQFILY